MWPNPRGTVNLLTFTEKILNPLSANPQNGETDSKNSFECVCPFVGLALNGLIENVIFCVVWTIASQIGFLILRYYKSTLASWCLTH